MELGQIKSTYSATGSRMTAAGLTDAFFTYQPKVLALDEIDKVPMDVTAVLLSVMETGGVFVAGTLVSIWTFTRAKQRGKIEAALAELERAHEILQHYVRSVRDSEKRQTILNAISSVLSESLDLERILNKAVHMVSELMEVEVTLIFSQDEEN